MSLPQVGDTASCTRTITDTHISAYADLTGDFNPVHVDEAYARTTRFGGRIAHGMFTAGLISAVLGNGLPGPGSIYLSQTLHFRSPVYPGEIITASVKVLDVRQDKGIVVLDTRCTNQRGETVVEGEAVLMIPADQTPGDAVDGQSSTKVLRTGKESPPDNGSCPSHSARDRGIQKGRNCTG